VIESTSRPGFAARFAALRTGRRAVLGLVGLSLAAGIALRVLIYRTSLGQLDIDEATWALMARHAEHGQLSAFFWGQAYGGTQEVIPVAALFAVFGTHLFLARLVPMLLSAASALVVWRIGRRTIGELPAVVAGLLLFVWPPYPIWKLEVWAGFYGGGLLYTTLILLVTLRLDESPARSRVALMGLVLGLGFWESVQTVAVIIPALAWLSLRRPRVWREAWAAVPGAAVGALPWILSNLRHDWWSLSIPGSGVDVSYVTRLRGFFTDTFPMLLGLRVPYSTGWIFGTAVTGLLYAAGLGLFGVFAWRWRRSQLSLFAFTAVAFPFLYAISGQTANTAEPRYVVLLAPVVVLMLATAATTLPRAVVLLAAGALISTVALAQWIDWTHTARGAVFNVVDVRPAIAALDRAGIDRAYSDYALAYSITFDTRERIIVSEADLRSIRAVGPDRVLPPVPTNHTMHHHPAYDTAVRAARRYAYIFVRGEPGEARDVPLLRAHGFAEEPLGRLVMLVSPPQPANG
jgi:Dolichyl-phosphate-mannose-protein mannosyltransferase